MLTPLLLSAAAGYLLGSLPFGYLVARAKGVNIFEVGSRNPGATNVRRALGAGLGNVVLALDAAKGAAAALAPWGYRLAARESAVALSPAEYGYLAIAGLAGAMIGHSFSCFTRFKGGKGVATGAGGFLVLFPVGTVIAAAVWAATATLTRFVSLASMIAAVSLPLSAFLLERSPVLVSMSALVAVFVIVRHRTNISRLIAGTELKIGQRRAVDPES
ncbi:MAG: glycerol-3-phosphate 1-O-acyltransferase PlsY [Verrucomicrobia bacterium]|nr:glycerol-3-phosphate 1-O-acyltransferase PlsY [Verrucomicrobiota bacterium]